METTQKNIKGTVGDKTEILCPAPKTSPSLENPRDIILLDKTINLLLEREENLLTDVLRQCSQLVDTARDQANEIHYLLKEEME